MKRSSAQFEVVEFLLLLATGERCVRVKVVGLVHPHVEPHLAVDPSRGDESFVDELSLYDSFVLNRGKLTELQPFQHFGLRVLLSIFLLVDRPVHLQVYKLIAH